jgi:hypothetical protein
VPASRPGDQSVGDLGRTAGPEKGGDPRLQKMPIGGGAEKAHHAIRRLGRRG